MSTQKTATTSVKNPTKLFVANERRDMSTTDTVAIPLYRREGTCLYRFDDENCCYQFVYQGRSKQLIILQAMYEELLEASEKK